MVFYATAAATSLKRSALFEIVPSLILWLRSFTHGHFSCSISKYLQGAVKVTVVLAADFSGCISPKEHEETAEMHSWLVSLKSSPSFSCDNVMEVNHARRKDSFWRKGNWESEKERGFIIVILDLDIRCVPRIGSEGLTKKKVSLVFLCHLKKFLDVKLLVPEQVV